MVGIFLLAAAPCLLLVFFLIYFSRAGRRKRTFLAMLWLALIAMVIALALLPRFVGFCIIGIQVQIPEGISQSELEAAVESVTERDRLNALARSLGLQEQLNAQTVKSWLYVHELSAEWGIFDVTVETGNTSRSKAEAAKIFAKALEKEIQRTLNTMAPSD